MGETFEEARKLLGFDLDFICRPKHTRTELRTASESSLSIDDFKRSCKELSHIRDSGDGHYSTKELRALGDSYSTWSFSGGKLSKVSVEYRDKTEEQIKFLTGAYGPPSNTGTSKLQNGYGATFESVAAFWEMPDGTHISAIETLESVGYLRHTLHVKFLSKEGLESEEVLHRVSEPPNPYKR
jgi:hypothetical protein